MAGGDAAGVRAGRIGRGKEARSDFFASGGTSSTWMAPISMVGADSLGAGEDWCSGEAAALTGEMGLAVAAGVGDSLRRSARLVRAAFSSAIVLTSRLRSTVGLAGIAPFWASRGDPSEASLDVDRSGSSAESASRIVGDAVKLGRRGPAEAEEGASRTLFRSRERDPVGSMTEREAPDSPAVSDEDRAKRETLPTTEGARDGITSVTDRLVPDAASPSGSTSGPRCGETGMAAPRNHGRLSR